MMKICYGICATAAICLPAIGAQADVIAYPDHASWKNAVIGSRTTIAIPDPAPDLYQSLGDGSGDASVSYDGVTFSTSSALGDGGFYNVGSLYSGSPAVLSSQGQSFGVANIRIILPGPDNAFSLDYGTFTGSDVTFLLSNGDAITEGSSGGGYTVPDFLGITDTTPFSWVLATTQDYVLNVNNVDPKVPEPASMAVLGTALIGFGVARRRRKAG